jgi:hypothetical protein
MANIYRLTPLSPGCRSIRLLNIYPEPNNDSSKAVSCDLSVINLDDEHPPFAALTYVWNIDAGEKLSNISCAGQTLSLTHNGHDALKHLRAKLGAFSIWVDAVCIDQANYEEKMDQIKLMGDIYAEAETVYVWLGSGSGACSRALKFVERAGFQRYFQWEPESASYETHKPETRKAAYAYAFGRMGSVKPSLRKRKWVE